MTVTYTKDLHTAGWFSFFGTLKRWKGSFYKLIFPQMLCFVGIYSSMMLCYHFVLSIEMRQSFENVISMFARHRGHLGSAVAFFLGFFIDQVFRRFWGQFLTIPWPDSFAFLCSVNIVGQDSRSRLMRRTLVRYVCAATIMGICQYTPKVARRFPTFKSYCQCDLLTENEANIIESKFLLYIKISSLPCISTLSKPPLKNG